MVANHIALKTIEAWMGHSDFRLTPSPYASPIKSGSSAALRMLEEVFPKEQLQNSE
jgi:hypothetical protein